MRVRKAVIPAAGRGTRMAPFSQLVPKELVPLGSRPALFEVIDEVVRADLREIVLVVREGKALLRQAVDLLLGDGDYRGVDVTFVDQSEPTGLADAIVCCRAAVGDEPFALVLPDNLLPSPEHDLGRMVRFAEETGRDVFGVIALDERHSGLYGQSGLIDYERVTADRFEITRLHAKRPGTLEIGPGETVHRTCARIVCQPHLFDVIERTRPAAGAGEVSEVPAYQAIIEQHGAVGCLLPPPVFDVGHPAGYLAACAWLNKR